MTNQMYDFGREGFLDGQISWSSNTIRAVLVDTAAYTFSRATHQWLSDIDAAARIAVSAPFGNKTIAAGIAGADPAAFTAVTGPVCEALVIYRDTGNAATSRLIAYITNANGLPVTPNGFNITVTWDTDASKKIFKL
ncbi:MAG: hypothetical protein ACOYB3_00140 [Azonexus sp.]